MMKSLKNTCGRRKFFRSSSFLLGSVLLPTRMLFNSTTVGSSIRFKMSVRDKVVGLKFTNISDKYVACTIRIPQGKKLLYVLIPRPTGESKGTNTASASLKLDSGAVRSVQIDTRKSIVTTNLEHVKIDPMQFDDSEHDDLPSAQGFIKWLKDAISDTVRVIAAGLTYLTGNEGDWILESGIWISVSKSGGFEVDWGGFKAEGGISERPGVWY